MPVSNNARIKVENGNGTKTAFDFAFKILSTSDIAVYKRSAGLAGDIYTYTLQTLGTDYTVSFDSDAETGTVTYTTAPVGAVAPPTGNGEPGQSIIIGAIAQSQATTLQREGVTPAKTLQNMIDKLTILVQELQEKLDRAPLQPLNPTTPDQIVIDAPVDNKLMYWDYNASEDKWHIKSSSVSATP